KKKKKEKRWKFWCWTTNQSTDQSITEPPAGLLQDAGTVETSPIFGAASNTHLDTFLFSEKVAETPKRNVLTLQQAIQALAMPSSRSKVTSRDESNPSVFSHVYPF
ncbi:unnamed protein product, partial [Ixodes pacificus]